MGRGGVGREGLENEGRVEDVKGELEGETHRGNEQSST